MMNKYNMVKLGEAKNRKLSQKKCKLNENKGEISKFCENRGNL